MLLALSALLPAVASADVSVTLTDVRNQYNNVHGFSCTAVASTATAGGNCSFGEVLDAVPGTQLFISITQSGGTAAQITLGFFCSTSATMISTKVYTNAAATFTYAAQVPGNCPKLLGFANTTITTGSTTIIVTGGWMTYTRFSATSTAAPEPTAAPHATVQPTAAPTPPAASGSIALDANCNFATYEDESWGSVCMWLANSAAQRTVPDPDDTRWPNDIASPGALCSSDWAYGPGPCYVDNHGYVVERLAARQSATTVRLVEYTPGLTVEGAVSVRVAGSCRGTGGSGPYADLSGCTYGMVVQVQMYGARGYTDTTGAFVRTLTGTLAGYGFDLDTGLYGVPLGTRYLGVTVYCESGTLCGNEDGTGNASFVDALYLYQYDDDTGAVPPATTCNLAGVADDCGLNPEPVIDPNDGSIICGPLSHDCTKPWVAPEMLAYCGQPTVALDVVGWLSYIACEVSNVPQAVWNVVGIPAMNTVIDLLWPGQGLTDAYATLEFTFSTRAVFAWVEPVATAWGEAWATIGTAPETIGVYVFKGQTVDLGAMLEESMGQLAPFRTMFLAVVMLGILLKIRRRILSALNGGSIGEGESS